MSNSYSEIALTMFVKLLLLSFYLIAIKAESDYVNIDLPNGPIFGSMAMTYSEKPYYSFQKIPYAAPPVGDLRFQAPVPPKDWQEPLNTTYLDAVCYQTSSNLPEETEDCLYINVYTPSIENSSNPVLFYIYGGGFTGGHAMHSSYGPEFLIDYDIVVVIFNYRLGPLGFLSTEDSIISGNNGLKDQELALMWTYDNIQLFGGDPEKITISGESAGGVSVGLQLLNKNVEGLFRGAILESGTSINPFALQRGAKERAFSFGAILNSDLDTDDSQTLLDYLVTVSAKDLDDASTHVGGWAPVIEAPHEDAFLTEKMYGLVKSGNFTIVPILMGINSEESLSEARNEESLAAIAENYDNHLETLVPVDMMISNVNTQKQFGKIIRQIYVRDGTFANNTASALRFDSDSFMNRPAIKSAELQSQFTDVYFYQFSYDGMIGNVAIKVEGAGSVSHAEDVRYLWSMTSGSYDNSDLSKFPEKDVITQERLLTLWTNFVKHLNPTPEKLELLQNVTWPILSSGEKGDFLYIDIDEDLEIKNHPKDDTYKGWTGVYGLLIYNDFDTY